MRYTCRIQKKIKAIDNMMSKVITKIAWILLPNINSSCACCTCTASYKYHPQNHSIQPKVWERGINYAGSKHEGKDRKTWGISEQRERKRGGERDRECIARQKHPEPSQNSLDQGWRNSQKIKTICYDALTLGVGSALPVLWACEEKNNQSTSEL